MFSVIGMLHCLLPLSEQHVLENAIDSGELVVNQQDPAAPEKKFEIAESTVNFVAKDIPTDTTRQIAKLNKDANNCIYKDK